MTSSETTWTTYLRARTANAWTWYASTVAAGLAKYQDATTPLGARVRVGAEAKVQTQRESSGRGGE